MLRSKGSTGEGELATGMLAGLAGAMDSQSCRGCKVVVALPTGEMVRHDQTIASAIKDGASAMVRQLAPQKEPKRWKTRGMQVQQASIRCKAAKYGLK